MAETVLIDFQVDYSELTNAQAELAKTGKIDDKGFQKIQAAINDTATDTKGLIKTFKDVAGASVKMGKTVEDAFGAGIQDALDEAGVSVEEFSASLKKANTPATSLRKELAQLKESMARMKAEGKDTGKEFDRLRDRAGQLADAIADVNAEIKDSGSDTKGIDNVVGSISALAGGYAAVQGAAALFGEENEDLQKALLKVNGAMALASGLQQTMNALQKEGSLALLATNIQTKAAAAGQYIYAAAVGTSTGAMRAFRIALLATGIGAIIVLIGLAADAMGLFGDNTEEAADKTQDLVDGLKNLNTELDNNVEAIRRNAALQLEFLKQRGASEQEIFNRSQSFSKAENQAILKNALEKIRLLGVEDLVRTKQDADNLLSIKTRLAGQRFITEKNKALLDEQIKGLQEVSDAFKRINDNEAASTLATEQFKTKTILEEKKKREEADKKEKEAKEKLAAEEKKAYEALIAYENQVAKAKKELRDADYIAHLKDLAKRAADRKQFYANALAAFKKSQDDEEAEYMEAYEKRIAKDKQDDADKEKADQEEEDRIKRRAALVLEVATRIGNIYSQLSQAKTDRDNAEIASERKKLDEQLKAGVITQKAFEQRQKKIDLLERAARQRAAEREKQAAVFQAVLAIPKAFLQGLSQGGYVLAAIYAALAAAEAAIIISKPIPKFFKGKKDKYAGPGMVADMGSELVERDGRMYLYTKPTQTYLGANDKVYTAAETRNIMHNTNINTTVRQPAQEKFDYERLGKAIPTNAISINIDKEFISESVANGLSKNNYFNKRYQFGK